MNVAEQWDSYPNNENQCFWRKEKKMPGDIRRNYELEAEIKLREQERIRDSNTNSKGASRLSRKVYVLIQLTVMLLIIVGIVIVYYLSH